MMTKAEVEALPDAQRAALRALWTRTDLSWEAFLEKCHAPTGVLVPYVAVLGVRGTAMIGIEPDGYTHS